VSPQVQWVEIPFSVTDLRGCAGLRVDQFLSRRLHQYSRSQVQGLIDQGRVFLRGRTAKASSRVQEADVVMIRYPRRPEPEPEHASLRVIHDDAELLAVDKPPCVLSHPTDKVLLNTVTTILSRQFPGTRLHLAHRLDRETSGVLVLAKDPATARDLTEQFTRRDVSKEYLALVFGRVEWERTTVDRPLGREGGRIKVRQAVDAEGGQPAVTEFERLAASEGMSLVRAVPRTGRLHQIRVHLASLGHPLLGDKLYLGDGEFYMKAVAGKLGLEEFEALRAPRQMLHANKVSLVHPGTGRRLELAAPLPADFREAMGGLADGL